MVRNQMLSTVDEIGKRIFLFQQLAIFIPLATHFLSTADVRNSIHEAAIQQRQTRR